MLRGRGLQVLEDILEREAVLRSQRQDDGVFGCRRLQLEVEAAAEALAQREAPGPVDPAAERRVQDQLHPARLVEEPLQDQAFLRGDRAENDAGRAQILDDRARARFVHADRVDQPLDRGGRVVQAVRDVLPQPRHFFR